MSALEILENHISLAKKQNSPLSPDVNTEDLFILFEWLFEVNRMFKHRSPTFYLGCAIMRRYVTFEKVTHEDLQGYGCMALHIAGCLIEVYPAEIEDYVCVSSATYTVEQMKAFYANIIQRLNGELFIPTMRSFDDLLFILGSDVTPEQRAEVLMISSLLVMNADSYKYPYHELAVMCIFLVKLIDGETTIKLVLKGDAYMFYCSTSNPTTGDNMIGKVHDIYQIAMRTIGKLRVSKKSFEETKELLLKFKFQDELLVKALPKQSVLSAIPIKQEGFELQGKVKELGKGSRGTVVKATIGKSTLAVKKQNICDICEAIKEIAIMSTLSDMNIQDIKGFSFKEDEIYFSMSLQKFSLYDLIVKNYPVYSSWEDVFINQVKSSYSLLTGIKRKIGKGILKGIAYLHSYGIIHSDIKPANILLSSSNVVKIADFGISKLFAAGEDEIKSRSVIATLGYRAPDLLKVELDNKPLVYSTGADIWSVGATLLGLEMGNSPFSPSDEMNTLSCERIDKIVKEMKLSMVKDLALRKLLIQMLRYDETERISARQALAAW